MSPRLNPIAIRVWIALAGLWFPSAGVARAADTNTELNLEFQWLQRTNAALQAQLERQQQLIESLVRKVEDLERTRAEARSEAMALHADPKTQEPSPAGPSSRFNPGKIRLSGEGAVGFFDTGPDGFSPNAEFRVDEAKLFVDAPVWNDVYAFAEINLAQREYSELELRLGEFYLDFEDVSQLWGHTRTLNVRAGRMDVPFGEEYLARDAIDNPLISHSLTDTWGVDEGIELYGALGKFSYVVAVQNGGISGTRDFDSDKSVTGRLSYDPTHWLHASLSGMRTGDLDANNDFVSELWFGGGWFRSIGSTNTTTFHANLVQADLAARWSSGHVKLFGGYARYDDNDPNASNGRDLYFYSIEGQQRLTRKLYAATRFSQIVADDGYPLTGHGDMGEYFFSPTLTENLWRLSLGLGYRWSENLLFKAEYAFERGKEVGGASRDEEDLFAFQAAMKF